MRIENVFVPEKPIPPHGKQGWTRLVVATTAVDSATVVDLQRRVVLHDLNPVPLRDPVYPFLFKPAEIDCFRLFSEVNDVILAPRSEYSKPRVWRARRRESLVVLCLHDFN